MVDEMFFPDADNVIPITDEEYLDDDIVSRLCTWLKAVYGADTLEANLDYIAKALGNKGITLSPCFFATACIADRRQQNFTMIGFYLLPVLLNQTA